MTETMRETFQRWKYEDHESDRLWAETWAAYRANLARIFANSEQQRRELNARLLDRGGRHA